MSCFISLLTPSNRMATATSNACSSFSTKSPPCIPLIRCQSSKAVVQMLVSLSFDSHLPFDERHSIMHLYHWTCYENWWYWLSVTSLLCGCLTLSRSSDDPFMLYAALYFGPETFIVTNDELRDHRHVLGNGLAARLKLWQRQRQITFSRNSFTGKFRFNVSCVILDKDLFVKVGRLQRH